MHRLSFLLHSRSITTQQSSNTSAARHPERSEAESKDLKHTVRFDSVLNVEILHFVQDDIRGCFLAALSVIFLRYKLLSFHTLSVWFFQSIKSAKIVFSRIFSSPQGGAKR